MPETLIRAKSIEKSYAGVHALRHADFELHAGEVHALIGENGAGKSTLIKIITGAVQADSGTLSIGEQEIAENSPAFARSLGVAVVYQQPSLFPHLTVAENIALALEQGGWWRRLDWKQRRVQARELLERAGSKIDPDRLVSTLSMPEQQIVEIAKAIGLNARVVIMDEPTASLTDHEVSTLFAVIRQMKAHGVGIIYVSHRLEEIAAIGDRVTVLRDGQTIATEPVASLTGADLIRLMVGRELSAVFPKRVVEIGETLLEVRGVSSRAAGVRDVSFAVRRGEIFGIAGLVGSGRTQLAELLFGLHPLDAGEIKIAGEPYSAQTPREAIRRRLAYVPEDRRRHGVILQMPIRENTSLAVLDRVSDGGLIDESKESKVASTFIERLAVKTPSSYAIAGSLSGGNQQKVAVARWLATDPQVVILDEPTQGVDVGSKAEIHKLIVELAEQGRAVIMISSELPEILGMSDRIAVMSGGTIKGTLSREEATQQAILSLALGHAPSESLSA